MFIQVLQMLNKINLKIFVHFVKRQQKKDVQDVKKFIIVQENVKYLIINLHIKKYVKKIEMKMKVKLEMYLIKNQIKNK